MDGQKREHIPGASSYVYCSTYERILLKKEALENAGFGDWKMYVATFFHNLKLILYCSG